MFRLIRPIALLTLLLAVAGVYPALAADDVPWRIRFVEAAVVRGPNVILAEVAVPVGEMPQEQWKKIAGRELWPSPPENGRPVNMTRPRLQEAVMATMPDLAPYCLFPGSMALQRGGGVIGREQIQDIVVKGLTPFVNQLPGENTLKDFRLPPQIFLAHPGQRVSLELPKKLNAGRVNFRILISELDDKVVQRLSASAFVDSWVEVPCAAAPLNREDVIEPDKVTFVRMNLAALRDTPWDGRGGPWRVMRPIGVQQVIYQSDLGNIPAIRKGAQVTLVYESKNVRLLIKAEALADGVTGQSIPVRNMQSRKELYGVVRDASTVVVSSPDK